MSDDSILGTFNETDNPPPELDTPQKRPRGSTTIFRDSMLKAMTTYISPDTGKQGLDAFLADLMYADPLKFLGEFGKLLPKQTNTETVQKKLVVTMSTDFQPDNEGGAQALPIIDTLHVSSDSDNSSQVADGKDCVDHSLPTEYIG